MASNKEGTVMRFIMFASVVALVALLMLGCVTTDQPPAGEEYVGRYVKEGNPSDYTELRADGTFVIEERGATLAGDYEVHGETLTIFAVNASATGIIKGQQDHR
jgi:hypothetical protein